MLPAPSGDRDAPWTDRYLTSGEANDFIKSLLERLGVAEPNLRIATHSCKTTSISWLSKYGVDGEVRSTLARRQVSVKGPTSLYSRDVLTPCLRSYLRVIEAIRKSHFQPDRTRSGMMTPQGPSQAAAPCAPVPPMGAEVSRIANDSMGEIADFKMNGRRTLMA